MNELVLSRLQHGLTPQWKKDYNHKYYMANKDKWSKYFTPSREDLKRDLKTSKKLLKGVSTTLSTGWKNEKNRLKKAAKRGYIEYDEPEYTINPSTNSWEITTVKRRADYNKRNYKDDIKEARRLGRQAVDNTYYNTKRNVKEAIDEIVKSVKHQMKEMTASDLGFGEKARIVAEGARIIATARAGQLGINMRLGVMKLKSHGFNPYDWG